MTLLPTRKTLLAVISTLLTVVVGCGVPNQHNVTNVTLVPPNSAPQFISETIGPIQPANYVQLHRLATVRSTGDVHGAGSAGSAGNAGSVASSSGSSSSRLQTAPMLQLGTRGDSAVWLNEALATLNYLPVKFIPSGVEPSVVGQTLANQVQVNSLLPSLLPVPGMWTWSGDYPTALRNLWRPDEVSVITQGAIISFERQHGLAVDGIAGPEVSHALVQALTADKVDALPYVYALVTKSAPEQIDVFENGQKVYSSLANTGIALSPTPNGTWPVYLRLRSQTMKGTDPSGQKYSDPGVPWISYFYQGDAIHGFPRASYGSPQSLGCVELSISAAKNVYSLVHYGTLVTVEA